MTDLRAGEKADEFTVAMHAAAEEMAEFIEKWRKLHEIPFGLVERTETAQERTRLVLERAGAEAMPQVRAALGW